MNFATDVDFFWHNDLQVHLCLESVRPECHIVGSGFIRLESARSDVDVVRFQGEAELVRYYHSLVCL